MSDSTTIVLTGGLTPDAPPAISSLNYNSQTLSLSVNFSDGSTQVVEGFGAYAQAIARQSVPVAGGVQVQAQLSMQAAPTDPTHLVRQEDLSNALTNSNLGQYAQDAAQSAQMAGIAKTASDANAKTVSDTAANVSAIYAGAQNILSETTTVSQSATNAVAGVAADAAAAKVLLTAGIAGNAPLTYLGYWNASTNSPTLTSGKGSEGDLYVVSVAGTTALDGNATWSVGDAAWFHNGAWQYYARAGWAAVAQTLNGLRAVSVGAAGGMASGPDATYPWALKDTDGFIRAALSENGFLLPGNSIQAGPVTTELETGAPQAGIRVVDSDGFVLSDGTGQFVAPVAVPTSFTAAEISAYDLDNKAFTASVDRQGFPTGQRPNAAYNLVISCGQSEQNGEVSLPLLTKSQPYDNLMIGNSPRCNDPNPTTTAWLPVGGSWVFNPLMPSAWNWQTNTEITRDPSLLNVVVPSSFTISKDGLTITTTDSTVDFTKVFLDTDTIQFSGFTGDAAWMNIQGEAGGNGVSSGSSWSGSSYVAVRSVSAQSMVLWAAGLAGTYSGVTIALYVSKDPCLGEDQTTCSVNYERGMDWTRTSSRVLVCGNTCVGNQTLAALSKGATPDIYARNADLTTGFKTLCGASSNVVYMLSFGQGGSDTNTSYATYLSEFQTYIADLRTDLMAITGQKQEPFFEWFVISGGNQPSSNTMSVARAQVDAFRNGLITNGYCVGPGYWSPDQYAHWSSNGERWFGAMRAKIRYRVVYLGLGWMPAHIRNAKWRGRYVLVNCHSPVGPLQFQKCWQGQEYVMLPNYGFSAYDSSGNALSIASVSMASDTSVLIELDAVPLAAPSIAYADWTADNYGSGNVCDSDGTQAFDDYVWADNTGQPFTENNAELVGKPYPLNNWLCPYYLTAEAA